MFHFVAAPPGYRKIMFVFRDSWEKRQETLAQYYLRTFSYLIPKDVEFWQCNDDESRAIQIGIKPVWAICSLHSPDWGNGQPLPRALRSTNLKQRVPASSAPVLWPGQGLHAIVLLALLALVSIGWDFLGNPDPVLFWLAAPRLEA